MSSYSYNNQQLGKPSGYNGNPPRPQENGVPLASREKARVGLVPPLLVCVEHVHPNLAI